MKKRHLLLSFSVLCIVTVHAGGQGPAARPRGYLTDKEMPNLQSVMYPAPTTGDARDTADRAIFRGTRVLEGSSRWEVARSDDNVSTAGLMKAFRCAVGTELNTQNAPQTLALVSRAFADTNRAIGPLKSLFQRRRPFLVDEGNICVARSQGLVSSFDYPSGHSTAGWAFGLILSGLVPERSTEILSRARAFGESRVVCGVHNASAVEAGRFGATAVFAVLSTSEEFQSDMRQAKEEIEALRQRRPLSAEACTAESAALATKPY